MGSSSKVVSWTAVMWLVLASSLWRSSQAIWLSLPRTGTKCVSEEIHHSIVVLADYSVVGDDQSANETATVSVKVTSPFGNNLYHQQNVTKGRFAFTTHESGSYMACFWVEKCPKGGEVSVSVDWKTGVAAKDWDSVAKKEKIEGVELELRKLEGAVDSIHENLLYLKNREAEMREVSERTNARVAWFSILSLAVCFVVSTGQGIAFKVGLGCEKVNQKNKMQMHPSRFGLDINKISCYVRIFNNGRLTSRLALQACSQ